MSSTPWLQELLRLALKATPSSPVPWDHDTFSATTGDKLVDPDDPGKDPRFRALVEAILFGRRFLKTYNLVLLAVLLVFTAWHWGETLLLRRQRKQQVGLTASRGSGESDEVWSSSSSTLEGADTPPVVF